MEVFKSVRVKGIPGHPCSSSDEAKLQNIKYLTKILAGSRDHFRPPFDNPNRNTNEDISRLHLAQIRLRISAALFPGILQSRLPQDQEARPAGSIFASKIEKLICINRITDSMVSICCTIISQEHLLWCKIAIPARAPVTVRRGTLERSAVPVAAPACIPPERQSAMDRPARTRNWMS